ncbi:NAD(P)/FAD-dependent oxidoreductase [Muricoccus radiodurans]|uniref:NAD(P)/FAD-dependent oxidoreductase n=1 Tax=Muricoccus radiodurans TaxID=2231721 RepID=UPI003CF9F0CA
MPVDSPAGAGGRVIVIGGGIAGLCTAWSLVRRGFRVTLFEQGDLPNPIGSSYDEHRIIRHVYGAMEGYARMMPDAFRAWQALWDDLGAVHLEQTASLHLMPAGQEAWIEGVVASQAEAGLGLREIGADRAREAWPMLRTERFRHILEAAGSGILFASRIVTDLVAWLERHGATLHRRAAVTDVDPVAGTVMSEGRLHGADVVVVAAGAWAGRLVPELRSFAVPSRQTVVFLQPPEDAAGLWARAPVVISRGESGVYILPPRRGMRLKVGDHSFSLAGDPDGDRVATDADVSRLLPAMAGTLRDVERYAVLQRKACYYTVTADERFHVAPLGPRGWIVSACSGHGFKFGALIGRGVAEVIAGERAAEDLPTWAGGGVPASRAVIKVLDRAGVGAPESALPGV